jgi:RNA polymerase sigma factor (sigma-70 family)
MAEPPRIPRSRDDAAAGNDLKLARAILEGSLTAWHEFIERYSGLIFGVIRRRLVAEDEDDIRSVYVDVLKSLYDGKLGLYRGEARLSTWLTVFTRSRAHDYYRQRYGRSSARSAHDKLTELDREILRLFYVDALPLEVVVRILRDKGHPVNAESIIESIRRADDCLDPRSLRRIGDEHHANAGSVDSARMLAYLSHLKMDIEEKNGRSAPDSRLMEREARETAERVRELVSRLPPEERRILYFRFDRGLSAKEISEKLGLGGQRRVYTLIGRVLRTLRKHIADDEQ